MDSVTLSVNMKVNFLKCNIDYDGMKFKKLIVEAKKLQKLLKNLQYLERKTKKNYLFECPECNFSTTSGKSFLAHFQLHIPVNFYYCTDCDFDTDSKENFVKHRCVHNRLIDNVGKDDDVHCNNEGVKFKCSVCGYRTKRKWNLSQHMLLHEKLKETYACHLCMYKTKFKRRLKLHLQDHVAGKRFQCPHCEYKTLRKGSLHQHIQIHSQEKRFKCSMCFYKANRKWSLRKHLTTHSKRKMVSKLQCDVDSKISQIHKSRPKAPLSHNDMTLPIHDTIVLSENVDNILLTSHSTIEFKELDLSWVTSSV